MNLFSYHTSSPLGSDFLKAFPASMKLVAQSCLFCSCIWRRAALQNAFPAAKHREKRRTETFTHIFYTLHLAYALIYALLAPSQVLRFAVIVPKKKKKNQHTILQLLKCVETDKLDIFSGKIAYRTAPVLGHLEHVGSSAVHLTRFFHFVMSSRQRKETKR